MESWSGIASTCRRHAIPLITRHKRSGKKSCSFFGQVGRSEVLKTENQIMNSQDSLWLLGAQQELNSSPKCYFFGNQIQPRSAPVMAISEAWRSWTTRQQKSKSETHCATCRAIWDFDQTSAFGYRVFADEYSVPSKLFDTNSSSINVVHQCCSFAVDKHLTIQQ